MSEPLLRISSPAFREGDWIPEKYTARGDNLSPAFELHGISPKAQSIAIILEDASHPIFPNYAHWLIWNISVQSNISEAISPGATVKTLGNAVQGKAYGRNKYKGPKPPLKAIHNYVFTIYTLDSKIELASSGNKAQLLQAMDGHILQKSTLTGKYQSHRNEKL